MYAYEQHAYTTHVHTRARARTHTRTHAHTHTHMYRDAQLTTSYINGKEMQHKFAFHQPAQLTDQSDGNTKVLTLIPNPKL